MVHLGFEPGIQDGGHRQNQRAMTAAYVVTRLSFTKRSR